MHPVERLRGFYLGVRSAVASPAVGRRFGTPILTPSNIEQALAGRKAWLVTTKSSITQQKLFRFARYLRQIANLGIQRQEFSRG